MRPVSLCCISKGEASLHRMLVSAAELVQEIVIVCDPAHRAAVENQTVIAQMAQIDLAPIRIIERAWTDDFSAQRQAGFDAATHDLVLWLDSDDTLVGADRLRAYLDAVGEERGAFQLMLDYDYAENTRQIRERIVPRHLGAWADRDGDPLEIHELWLPAANRHVESLKVPAEVAHVAHAWKDEDEQERLAKRARNRRLLEKHAARRKAEGRQPDRRLVSHLVDQLIVDGDYPRAIRWASELAGREPHGWCRHRLYVQLAVAHGRLRDYKAAVGFATLALSEVFRSAEARALLVELNMFEGRPQDAWAWYTSTYESGLPLEVDPIGHDPRVLKPNKGLAARILLDLRDFEQALRYASESGDAVIFRLIRDEVGRLRAADGAAIAMDLVDSAACRASGADPEFRRQFCEMLPREVQDYPQIARWLLPTIGTGRPAIAIHCGQEGNGMTDTWGPDSLGRGVGGSEEAVLRVAPELARLGAHVEVYGPWPKDEVRDGVHYLYWAKWDPARPVDLFIGWRYEGLCLNAPGAKRRVLWLHDQVPPGCSFAQIDEVWCLSQSHAGKVRAANPDAPPIWVTRNGIPPAILTNALPAGPDALKHTTPDRLAELVRDAKVPGRVIWASSPDRGLDILLDMWPAVREVVPNATLDVFYGFAPSYIRAEQGRPELKRLRLKIEAQLLALRDHGVNYEGMVGAERLHRAFLEAEVWAYPTHWPETSCITAMKAQALGCRPVTVPLTALGETVQWGRLLPLGGPDMQAEWDERDRLCYQEALIGALNTPWADRGWTPDLATRFGWDGVARDWMEHLKELTNGPEHTTARRGDAGCGPGAGGPGGRTTGPRSGDGRCGSADPVAGAHGAASAEEPVGAHAGPGGGGLA